MARKIAARAQFNLRVTARALFAKELRTPERAARAADAGLLDVDLAEIQSKGELAERYDREQHADLASQHQKVSAVAERWRNLVAERDALRGRVPAVVLDLAADPATADLARWLDKVSFERFRLRAAAAAAPGPEGSPPVEPPARKRVVREDRLSAAQQVAGFTRSLLDPQRAPIVAALEARGFARERLQQLASAAEGQIGDSNSNQHLLVSPEATRLEAEAVAAQSLCWEACRRMLRAATVGDSDLERFWRLC